jgi:HEAT repeat protein
LPVLKATSRIQGLIELSAIAISQIAGGRPKEALADLLEGGTDHIRAIAALSLGALSYGSTCDRLLSMVTDDSPVVRANVAVALGELKGSSEITSALGRLSRDPEPLVVMAALNSLVACKDENTFDLLCTACTESSDDRITASAISALGERGGSRAIDFVKKYLSAPDSRVRANAVEAVGRLQLEDNEIRQHLAPLVADTNNRVVANVIVALQRSEPGKTLQVVRSLLGSDDQWTVASGIWCLGQMRQPEAFKLLLSVIKSFKDDSLFRALRSLDSWPSTDFSEEVFSLLTHENAIVRERIARFSARIKGGRVTSVLAARFAVETDAKVRSALVFAIGMQRSPDTFNFLISALKDTDDRVVADAVEVLAKTGDMQLPAILRPLVSHRNNRVAANACMALWSCGELDVADDLLKMFRGGSKDLISAIYAAGEIGRTLRVIDDGTSKAFMASLKRISERMSPADVIVSDFGDIDSIDYSKAALQLEKVVFALIDSGAEKALELVTIPDADFPFHSEMVFLSYRLRAEIGDESEAFRLLESIGISSGVYINPVLELAHCYSRLKLEDKAVVAFMEAYSRHQAVLSELLEAGADAVSAEKLSDATHICKYIMTNPAMGSDSHLKVARELMGAGDAVRAFPHMNRAHLNSPRDCAISMEYALVAMALGYHENCSIVCDEIMKLGSEGRCDAAILERTKVIRQRLEKGL